MILMMITVETDDPAESLCLTVVPQLRMTQQLTVNYMVQFVKF